MVIIVMMIVTIMFACTNIGFITLNKENNIFDILTILIRLFFFLFLLLGFFYFKVGCSSETKSEFE